MDFDSNTGTAVLWALRLAEEHGGAQAALRAYGVDLADAARFEGVSEEISSLLAAPAGNEAAAEVLALGLLAGRVAPDRPRARGGGDPTSFVMDRELLVTGAHGESVMRLPWFEDDLFVGRQLPDISEMPAPVRKLCVKNYSSALGGKRSRFAFTSYGHAYSVDAVPVRGDGGSIDAVLAVATPGRTHAGAACVYERTAQRLADVASRSEERAESHRRAGRSDAEAAQRQAAEKARAGAERARHNAAQLRSRHAGQPATTPSISPREAEVLQLASHGLTHGEIAEELVISPTTVRTHMENIFPKLGVADKAAAVATALRHGLID